MDNLIDIRFEINQTKMKMDALKSIAYQDLESVESLLNSEWVQKNKILNKTIVESNEKLYVIATLISDINKSVESIQDAINEIECSTDKIY
ncbi:hypothetical protein [Macrococcoides bohemicum]|uniref:hypothetical protein n=1 Tax=Macrococcoides bohemicum TaxID=1903056 RepID=UPI0019401FBE|nr:hypothetical protein [Macrococcus bohemicus]QRN49972.1 hypothetical protein HT586_07140 [Macrococcus bohemicus]